MDGWKLCIFDIFSSDERYYTLFQNQRRSLFIEQYRHACGFATLLDEERPASHDTIS